MVTFRRAPAAPATSGERRCRPGPAGPPDIPSFGGTYRLAPSGSGRAIPPGVVWTAYYSGRGRASDTKPRGRGGRWSVHGARPGMNDEAARALAGILASEGPGIVDEPRRLAALLADRCADDRLELNLLTAALEEGVPEALLRGS